MSDKPTGVHERLRLARERAGLSQGQVSRLMGLHRPTVSEIEAGRRGVDADELRQFAEHYDVSVDWIVGKGAPSDTRMAKIQLAAKELSKLKEKDIEVVLEMLASLKRAK